MHTIRPQPPVITVIEHEGRCPIDLFGDWLQADLHIVRPYLGDLIPEQVADGLIVLGGTEHALADAEWPWLPAVRELLVRSVNTEIPTLGICLGHQLLGVALGGSLTIGAQAEQDGDAAYRGPEYGVTALKLTSEGNNDLLLGHGAVEQPVTMMHNDVLTELPDGAVRLATSARSENAAFSIGDNAWGLQFHPEASISTLTHWVHDTPELDDSEQTAILHEAIDSQEAVQPFAQRVAEQFGQVAARRVTSRL